MKNALRIGSILAALGVVATAVGPTFADSTADAGWAKMTQCAAITDDNTRHSCTDDALRDAGLLESKATAKRKTFGLNAAPSPLAAATAPAATPPAAANTAAPTPKNPAAKKEKEQVEVTLAKVEQGGDKKLVLTTSDGAVWRQVESEEVRSMPTQGQTMKIEAGSFGGFMCQTGKYVWFRCYRSR